MKEEPDNHLLYSNRSASHASLHHFAEALADAKECIRLSPEWVSLRVSSHHPLPQLSHQHSIPCTLSP